MSLFNCRLSDNIRALEVTEVAKNPAEVAKSLAAGARDRADPARQVHLALQAALAHPQAPPRRNF